MDYVIKNKQLQKAIVTLINRFLFLVGLIKIGNSSPLTKKT